VVSYLRGGTTLYSSAQTPAYPLLVDTSLYTTGATVNAATIGGTWR